MFFPFLMYFQKFKLNFPFSERWGVLCLFLFVFFFTYLQLNFFPLLSLCQPILGWRHIALSCFSYLIVHIFTDAFTLKSYLCRGTFMSLLSPTAPCRYGCKTRAIKKDIGDISTLMKTKFKNLGVSLTSEMALWQWVESCINICPSLISQQQDIKLLKPVDIADLDGISELINM